MFKKKVTQMTRDESCPSSALFPEMIYLDKLQHWTIFQIGLWSVFELCWNAGACH